MPTASRRSTSTPTCAAPWSSSVSQPWWVLFFITLRAKEPEELSLNFCFLPPLQILVIIGLTHALVIFRVIAAVLLANGSWEFLSNHSNTGAMMLGAVLHYLIITVMTRVRPPTPGPHLCGTLAAVGGPVNILLCLQVNRIVAMKLCEIGTFSRICREHLDALITSH